MIFYIYVVLTKISASSRGNSNSASVNVFTWCKTSLDGLVANYLNIYLCKYVVVQAQYFNVIN